MKKRKVYWLTGKRTQIHYDKAHHLNNSNFEVSFFDTFKSLVDTYNEKRVNVIIVGDEDAPKEIQDYINKLSSSPEFHGVRLILSISSYHTNTINRAFHNGFRDIIPLDLDDNQWLQRFLFTVGGVETQFNQPLPQMTLRNISAISVPARIVWISDNLMRIETRIKPKIGDKVQLKGSVVSTLSMKLITLTVEKIEKTDLIFRYSESIICHWEIPDQKRGKRKLLLEHLKDKQFAPSIKVFSIVKSANTRTKIFNSLSYPKFEVITALNQKNIVNEPKFFNPDIILIEDQMCSQANYRHLQNMGAQLDNSIPIIIIGSGINTDDVKKIFPERKIIINKVISATFPNLIENRILKNKEKDQSKIIAEDQKIHINKESDFSIAEINFSARLTRIHPSAAQLALPVPLGNYGLCKIESPFLKKIMGRDLHAKITDAYEETRKNEDNFKYYIDCNLADLMVTDRKKIGHCLGLIMTRKLSIDTSHMNQKLPVEELKIEESAQTETEDINIEPITIEVPKRKHPPTTRDDKRKDRTLLLTIFFILFSIISMIAIYYGFNYLKKHWPRSGQNYSDQLERFKER